MAPRILLVEDNEELAAGIRHNLELEGYRVDHAATGPDAVAAAADPPDLLILDIMLPGMDGFQVLRTLRSRGFDRPVLILTARGEEADKVRGFRLDADQYVTKPFGLLELLERVAALLRRRSSTARANAPPDEPNAPRTPVGDDVIEFGAITVHPAARRVTRNGEEVQLTPRAYELLMALIRNEGRVLTRQDLLRDVWGHLGAVVTRTVDSHISELRQKLEDDPAEPRHIHTVWKVGYRFEG